MDRQFKSRFKPSHTTEPLKTSPFKWSTCDLYHACAEGNLKIVREILEQNAIDVNTPLDPTDRKPGIGQTPLMIAAQKKNIPLVNFLLTWPGIDCTLELNSRTALDFSLNNYNHFKDANFTLASILINAGAKIDHIISNTTILLRAWLSQNQEAALKLILILGANLEFSETLYYSHLQHDYFWKDIPDQIAQTKELIKKIPEAKQLGIDLGRLFFVLPKGLDQKISTFLFEPKSVNMLAFEAGRRLIRKKLTPPTLTWMQDFVNEAKWRAWEHEYTANPSKRAKAESGYGPGAMVRYEPN